MIPPPFPTKHLQQAAGARVVPIFYDMSRAEVEDRFKLINGLLIPGGGANLTPGHQVGCCSLGWRMEDVVVELLAAAVLQRRPDRGARL